MQGNMASVICLTEDKYNIGLGNFANKILLQENRIIVYLEKDTKLLSQLKHFIYFQGFKVLSVTAE